MRFPPSGPEDGNADAAARTRLDEAWAEVREVAARRDAAASAPAEIHAAAELTAAHEQVAAREAWAQWASTEE